MSHVVTMLCFGELVVNHWTMFSCMKTQIKNMITRVFAIGQMLIPQSHHLLLQFVHLQKVGKILWYGCTVLPL